MKKETRIEINGMSKIEKRIEKRFTSHQIKEGVVGEEKAPKNKRRGCGKCTRLLKYTEIIDKMLPNTV